MIKEPIIGKTLGFRHGFLLLSSRFESYVPCGPHVYGNRSFDLRSTCITCQQAGLFCEIG